jgi:hypothetical protein
MKYVLGKPISLSSRLLSPLFLTFRSDNAWSHVIKDRELLRLLDDTHSKLTIAVVVHDDLWIRNGI